MISLVFEDFKERKVRKVVRTDKVWGVIRTERTHICNRCGGSMDGRPSWHWLCYSCWSEIHYGRKAGHGKWYGDESPTRKEKDINGWIEKRVEVEEEYFETGKRIAVITPPMFSIKSKLVSMDFSSLSEAKKLIVSNSAFNLYSDEIINKHYDYFAVKSLQEAVDLSNKNSFHISKSKLLKLPKIKITEHRKKYDFNDMVGYFPNVPAYIQGNPLSMFNRKLITTFTSSVDLFFNLSVNLETKSETYSKRGQKFCELVENLLIRNISIKANIIFGAHTDSENLIVNFKINQQEWDSEKKLLYYMLTKISFVRLFLVNYLLSNKALSSDWTRGFGQTIDEDELKKLLKLNQETTFLSDLDYLKKFFIEKHQN